MFTLLPTDVQNAIGRETMCKVQYRDSIDEIEGDSDRIFTIVLYSEPSKELIELITDKYHYNGIYLKSSITNKHGLRFSIGI